MKTNDNSSTWSSYFDALRESFDNSFFHSKEFDPAIRGINFVTHSVIYDSDAVFQIIKHLQEENESIFESEDFFDAYCLLKVAEMFNEQLDTNGKVPPSLFLSLDGLLDLFYDDTEDRPVDPRTKMLMN